MVEYPTRGLFLRFAQEGAGALQESVKTAQTRSAQNSVFLSHSSADTDLLPGVIALLEGHGAQHVYIDKIDSSLPHTTSRETARIIKERIGICRKFLVLATEKSKDSRWVPWELGIADGVRTPANTAILPGLESATDFRWTEREYLGVYDRVVWGVLEGESDRVWMVYNHEANSAIRLSKWLAR